MKTYFLINKRKVPELHSGAFHQKKSPAFHDKYTMTIIAHKWYDTSIARELGSNFQSISQKAVKLNIIWLLTHDKCTSSNNVVTALSYLDHYQRKKRKCQLTHCTRVVTWDRWTDVALLIASAIRSEDASVDTTAMFFSWNSTFSINQ